MLIDILLIIYDLNNKNIEYLSMFMRKKNLRDNKITGSKGIRQWPIN